MVVYFTDEQTESRAFVTRILQEVYRLPAPQFLRGEHGKPRLVGAPLCFNLSHTHGRTFAVFSVKDVGLDAEWCARPLPKACLARLTAAERQENFFRLWTAKEAYIKYRGGTLAAMLPALRFEGGRLTEGGIPVDAHLAFAEADGFCIALCTPAPAVIELKRI